MLSNITKLTQPAIMTTERLYLLISELTVEATINTTHSINSVVVFLTSKNVFSPVSRVEGSGPYGLLRQGRTRPNLPNLAHEIEEQRPSVSNNLPYLRPGPALAGTGMGHSMVILCSIQHNNFSVHNPQSLQLRRELQQCQWVQIQYFRLVDMYGICILLRVKL